MPIPHFSNPGLSGLDELTTAEEAVVASIASLGTSGQVLTVNATEDGVEWGTPSGGGGGGDVSASANFGTDNVLIRSDGSLKVVQSTGITVSDTTNDLGEVGSITTNEAAAPGTPAAGKVVIYAKTNGKLYIKDDAGTETDLTAAGGGGISNIVEDTTPQLGGDLDLNDNNITSTGGTAVAITKTGAGSLTVSAAEGGLVLSTTSGNSDIDISPHGTGDVILGTLTLDGDQTVGASQDNYVLTYNHSSGLVSLEAAAGGGGGGAGATELEVTQASHGLAVGDVVKFASGSYSKAQADSAANAEVVGIISAVADTDNFTVTQVGYVTGLSGLTANTVYFLDPSTAGAITATETTTTGEISKPVLLATSTTTGWVLGYRGLEITAAGAGGGSGTADQSVNTESAGSATLVTGELSDSIVEVLNIVESNAASQTITLPAAVTGDIGKYYRIYNKGTNRMTITSASTLNGDSVELAREAGCVAYVEADGEYRLVGTGNVLKDIQLPVIDWTTNTATGDGKYYFRVPEQFNTWEITDVHAEVITAGTTGTTDIQIHNVTDTADVLSTKLTIDSGETGSDTAATAAVINTSNDELATNDVLRVDIDAVSTTPAQGLLVTLTIQPK